MKKLFDVVREHPVGTTLSAGAVAYIAAHAFYSGNYDDTPDFGKAEIVCTGEQTTAVHRGETLSGLVEAHVETNPSDRLKSAGRLAEIATAIAYGPYENGNYYYWKRQPLLSGDLRTGITLTLPQECELVNPEADSES